MKIAALAATRGDEAAFDELDALIAAQEEAKLEPARYRDVDAAFHLRLGDLGGNEFLSRAAQSLNVLGQEFRKTASETPNVSRPRLPTIASLSKRSGGAMLRRRGRR